MIRLDVQHRADVHVAHRHAGAQQSATRRLEHRDLHRRIAEDDARRRRPRHVALHGALPVDIDAIRRRQADALSRELVDVREQASRRRLAVRPRDRRDGNRARRVLREEHLDDLARRVARTPFARCRVHAKARGGIHLAHRTADILVRLRDVRRQEVHTANVQADRLDGAHRHLRVVRMHDVGHVRRRATRRQIRREPEVDLLSCGRDRVARVAQLREQPERLRVELDLRQHLLVPDAAPRIAVDDRNELVDRVRAVADHLAGFAFRHRHELAIHHEHAMIVAGDVALDDHALRVRLREREAGPHLVRGGEGDGHAASMIAVVRLRHHRIPDPLGRRHRAIRRLHEPLLRDRQAEAREDPVRLLLVARQFHGHVRRAAGDRCLDALLVAAVAELDETLVVQPKPGDAALFRRVHDARGAGAEGAALRIANEVVAADDQVERVVEVACRAQLAGQQRVQQVERDVGRLDAHVLLLVLEHHVVHARARRFPRLAERHLHARDVLELDRDVLQHMPEPGAFILRHPPDKPARHAVRAPVLVQPRQRLEQLRDESRAEPARGPLFELTEVELQADDGKVRVMARADVGRPVENLHECWCPVTKVDAP